MSSGYNNWTDPNPSAAPGSYTAWNDYQTWIGNVTHVNGASIPNNALPINGGPGLPSDFSNAGTPAYTTDFNALKSQLTTPGKIVSYIDQNFTWAIPANTNSGVMSPSQLNAAKVGMCSDMAAFDAFFLNNAGYATNILHFTWGSDPVNQSHWVTMFADQGTDWLISNGSLVGPVTGPDSLTSTLAGLENTSVSSLSPIEYYPYNGNKYFAQQS